MGFLETHQEFFPSKRLTLCRSEKRPILSDDINYVGICIPTYKMARQRLAPANQVTYTEFLQSLRNLSVEEIRNLWQTQTRYCQRPTFWEDLLRQSYDLDAPNAEEAEYAFVQELFVIQPGDEATNYNLQYRLLNYLRETEIQGWLQAGTLQYWQINPLMFYGQDPVVFTPYLPIRDTFFQAFTLDGAILKMYQALLPSGFNLLDDIFQDLTEADMKIEDAVQTVEDTFNVELGEWFQPLLLPHKEVIIA